MIELLFDTALPCRSRNPVFICMVDLAREQPRMRAFCIAAAAFLRLHVLLTSSHSGRRGS